MPWVPKIKTTRHYWCSSNREVVHYAERQRGKETERKKEREREAWLILRWLIIFNDLKVILVLCFHCCLCKIDTEKATHVCTVHVSFSERSTHIKDICHILKTSHIYHLCEKRTPRRRSNRTDLFKWGCERDIPRTDIRDSPMPSSKRLKGWAPSTLYFRLLSAASEKSKHWPLMGWMNMDLGSETYSQTSPAACSFYLYCRLQ